MGNVFLLSHACVFSTSASELCEKHKVSCLAALFVMSHNSKALVLLCCLMTQWTEKSITVFSIFLFFFLVAPVVGGLKMHCVALQRQKEKVVLMSVIDFFILGVK